jgi:F-type H+/Na+-transporting ATPase subunit alpha
VGRFEQSLLGLVRGKHADILQDIRTAQALTPEIETKLKAVLEELAKTFA